MGPLLISSSGMRSYCVCGSGSSNLNTVTALLMVLALTDSRARPAIWEHRWLCSPRRASICMSCCPCLAVCPHKLLCSGCPVLTLADGATSGHIFSPSHVSQG